MEKLKRSDARTYWTKLKNFLGIGKGGQQLPKEILVNEAVRGEAANHEWREAFLKLGQAYESDTNFDGRFFKDCKEQIASWMKLQKDAKGELDRPIERREVVKAVKSMKSGKACGIDGISCEILKNGAKRQLNRHGSDVEVFEAE